MIARVGVAIILSACAGALAGRAVRTGTAPAESPRVRAVWVYHADSAAQMARDVDVVVAARHEGVHPGRIVYSTRGEAPLAFETDDFVTVRGFKGLRTGERFVLERVATDQLGRTVSFDADGGAYEPGQIYVLFLRRQAETGFYFLVNDQARYTVDARGALQPIRQDDEATVSRDLAGRRLADLAAIVHLP